MLRSYYANALNVAVSESMGTLQYDDLGVHRSALAASFDSHQLCTDARLGTLFRGHSRGVPLQNADQLYIALRGE